MGKMLRCQDVMGNCDAVLYGKDEDEVIAKAEEHARKEHNMTMIPPDVVREIANHITDGEEPRRRWFTWGR
ncbi:MAG TPA: DUF1059 domain-containing protein [Dehalococcoidia bacterium]|nr:DUF1059 domain-containing protein [Dehalococcoidia bacterium]